MLLRISGKLFIGVTTGEGHAFGREEDEGEI